METIKLVIIIVSLVILVGVWSVFIFFSQQKKKTPNLTFSAWFLGKEQGKETQPISTPTTSSIPTEGTQQTITQPTETKPFEFKGDEPLFILEESKEIFKIPDFPDQKQVDCKYPLIPPYTYAHIQWNNAASELVYTIEEPILTEEEKKLLEQLEEGTKELINLSFINVKDVKTVIAYLEKNIRVLLTELAIPVSKESFVKIMYYIYRDFVGLNDLEPLMNDPNIEDIECNGVKTPVYVVHRKFRNIRTSLVYPDIPHMASFVEKLAQKCGKYISYADPILDGSLPGGSRVNATYSTDISTRGPTFTIRKFTSEPWSGIQLMMKGTASAEMLAYLWMLLEYENSMMVIGGTGSGKCVTGDTKIYLPNGRIIDIKSFIENKFKSNTVNKQDDWEFVNSGGEEILSLSRNSLKIGNAKVEKFWRHSAPSKLLEVSTRSGRKVRVTLEHPFFINDNGDLIKIRADKLKKGIKIAVPRYIPLTNPSFDKKLNLIELLKNRKDLFITSEQRIIKRATELLCERYNFNIRDLAKKYGVSYRALLEWRKNNAIPIQIYLKIMKDAGFKIKNNLTIKGKAGAYSIKSQMNITADLFRFVGLLIADGHLDKTQIQLFNVNKRLRREFLNIGRKVFEIEGREEFPKDRTPKAIFSSVMVATILNEVFEVPYGNKARKVVVPKILFNYPNEYISSFLQGLFDCESHVSYCDIEFSTTSNKLSTQVNTLLLRLGILSHTITRKNHYRIYVSGLNNLKIYNDLVGFKHQDKNISLTKAINRPISKVISNVDLIPNVADLIKDFRKVTNLTQKNISDNVGVSRRLVGMWETGFRSPSIHTFRQFNDFTEQIESNTTIFNILKGKINRLAESDIYWDEITNIKLIKNHDEKYVYDLTVEKEHNFIAGEIPMIVHNTSLINAIAFFIPPQARVVTIEDTPELKLEHENWLPSVSRAGVGNAGAAGQKHGEVSLFDLLKASFRQRPDYIIVGEVRGAEASVLMQSAASGHACMGTMHAESVDTMVRRLQTPPISLSGALIESLAGVAVMQPTKVKGQEVRRLTKIDEIVKVKENLGGSVTNTVFKWIPQTDTFAFNPNSNVIKKIGAKYGMTEQQVLLEMKRRSTLLRELLKRNVTNYKDVQRVINLYYKDPKTVLKAYGIKI